MCISYNFCISDFSDVFMNDDEGDDEAEGREIVNDKKSLGEKGDKVKSSKAVQGEYYSTVKCIIFHHQFRPHLLMSDYFMYQLQILDNFRRVTN